MTHQAILEFSTAGRGTRNITESVARVVADSGVRTGIAHVFINNTDADVRLLVVGEASRQRSRIDYPLHPKRNAEIGSRHWKDKPRRAMGSHDGKPDKAR